MVMKRRAAQRQREFWVAGDGLVQAPTHVFYETLNGLLADADFDRWIEDRCREFYSDTGRGSIPPGVYFRMVFIGYFEDIDSQRGIAWRCADSLSLRKFLGYELHEETPDHSSMSIIKGRLPADVFTEVFEFVLRIVDEHGLLKGRMTGVDATTLEANASMKTIVRKDSGEDWEEYLRRLAEEEGVEINDRNDLIRFDKQRKKQGKKKVSNDEWESPGDPDARIGKMKDGRTHLMYKAEHVVDLETEVILAAVIYHGDQGDAGTLINSLEQAGSHLVNAEVVQEIEKVVADKGYHKAETLADCEEIGPFGIKPYIPEPDRSHERRWDDKPQSHKRAVYNNRARTKRGYGRRLQRRRSEVVERSFAHVCETGGSRRTWLRGLENVQKRYSMQAAAHNLGLILRKLLGSGKPREFAATCAFLLVIYARMRSILDGLWEFTTRYVTSNPIARPNPVTRGWYGWVIPSTCFSTGC